MGGYDNVLKEFETDSFIKLFNQVKGLRIEIDYTDYKNFESGLINTEKYVINKAFYSLKVIESNILDIKRRKLV